MGTHLRVLSVSVQMNTNMTGFKWFSKEIFVSLCLIWTKVASTLEGFTLSMLRLLSSKAQECKDFEKNPSKPCHVGIQWKALTEYSHMGPCARVSVIIEIFCIT